MIVRPSSIILIQRRILAFFITAESYTCHHTEQCDSFTIYFEYDRIHSKRIWNHSGSYIKIYHMMFLTPLGSSSLGLHTPSPRKGYTNHSSAKYKLRSGIKLHNLNILSDIIYCVALDPSKKTGWAERH